MTIFLTLYLIVFLGFWIKPKKHRSKGTVRCVCLLWGFDSNLECHLNIEVWNSFLVLSCLSVFMTTVDAYSESSLNELLQVLGKMKHIFEKSDAQVYAPVPDTHNCTSTLLYCYLLELQVLVTEEDDPAYKNELQMLFVLKEYLKNCSHKSCRECETHPVANATVFSNRMREFIQKLLSHSHMEVCA